MNGEPSTYNEAIQCDESPHWIEAMIEEYRSLIKNDTWQLVPLPPNRKAITCKWLYKKKINSTSEPKFKARLVARGYSQKFGEDYDEVFAPVVRQSTLRTLLSKAANKQMDIIHFDAKTAFLNGELEETIYMNQPQGFQEDNKESHVCLLKRSLYGLKQSARVWNQTLHRTLTDMGLAQSNFDPCLYTEPLRDGSMYVIVYVDDILAASNSRRALARFEEILKKYFDINNLGPVSNYLGINITRDDHHFHLDQKRYIEKVLAAFSMTDAKSCGTPMSVSYLKDDPGDDLISNNNYRKAIGSLLYMARPSTQDPISHQQSPFWLKRFPDPR